MSSVTTQPETGDQPKGQTIQLTFPKAINFLVQGVNLAQSKGIYSLADANLLHQSIALVNKVMVQSFGPKQEAVVADDDDSPSNPGDKQKAQ
jgi:hypothetical protein